MRRWIEYAVENYRSKNSFGFQLAKDLKERQVSQAIEKYAKIVKPEEVVALMDTTVFRSGKTGFLFTERYLYGDRYKDEGPIELMFLEKAEVRPENNSCCVLTYEDGRTREVDVSVFLDVVDVLNMMIRQRKQHEGDEEEGEHLQEADQKERAEFEKAAVSVAPARITERVGMDGNEDLVRSRRAAEDADTPESAGGAGAAAEATEGGRMEENQAEGAKTTIEVTEKTGGFPAIEVTEGSGESEQEEHLPIEIIQLEDLTDLEDLEDIEDIDGSDDLDESEVQFGQEDLSGTEQSEGSGLADAQSYEQALKLAEEGDGASMYRLAMMYYNGEQTDKDVKQALRWFRESAKEEYVPAMLRMMQFYRDGEQVKQNFQLSMSWVKKAAATGDPRGQFALADAYIYGLAGRQDVDAGLAILGERAALGDESAERLVEKVLGDIQDARERFDAGIRNPSTASGYYEMGMYCQKGDGYYTYPREAAEYFQKAAEKEHVDAQYQLACAYYYGEGVKKNEELCVQWLEKAAAKSHKEAMELLNGIQEKQKIKREKADFKSSLKQAEKGDAYAQSRVAEFYLNGTGVKKDIQKGIEWYEKASETDEGYAARQLAKLYAEGGIIPVDEERAAYWRMVGGVLDEL
ncbi:MAG: sel1 repeat family protein [Dorea sp.]|uniref:tetratricopeptide repeat protein n=1 Tax=Sporofaciens sp. JLR.KK001 TaxID=3112621 RepID=UPI0021732CAE|nr:sel1 repeat family protein [Dorea sp.]